MSKKGRRGNISKRNTRAKTQSNGLYMKPVETKQRILESQHKMYEFCKDKTLEELQEFSKEKVIAQFPKKHMIEMHGEQVEEIYFVSRKLSGNDMEVILDLIKEKSTPKK